MNLKKCQVVGCTGSICPFYKPSQDPALRGRIVLIWVIILGAVASMSYAADIGQIDTLAGNPGWTGAGLLGALLCWLLLRHLPAKDQQIADLLARSDSLINTIITEQKATVIDIIDAHTQAMERQRVAFREALQDQAAQTNREVQGILDATGREITSVSNASTGTSKVLGEAVHVLGEAIATFKQVVTFQQAKEN
jgi:hypothetical protein